MKQRLILVTGINLLCLLLLLNGRRLLAGAGAAAQEKGPVLIERVYYDGYAHNEPDEAVALRNMGSEPVDIGAWTLSDSRGSTAAVPAGTQLAPFTLTWLTGNGGAFQEQFGFAAPIVLERWPGFANEGDAVLLFDQDSVLVDTLVYGAGDTSSRGWTGKGVQPYTVPGVFGREGQILFRRLNEQTGRPQGDSDQAADWAQEGGGRRVLYPGWDMASFFYPVRDDQPANLTIAVAPDNAFEALAASISGAQESLQICTLTMENLAIGEALVQAAQRGVRVTVLMEGGPVGGIDDHEKAICRDLEAAGGQCWFMINDAEKKIYDRYSYVHAKYLIVDGKLAIIGSENLSANSMPYDDKRDGTWGRRGVFLMTEAPRIVEALEQLFAHDLDPANHRDIKRWRFDDAVYGAPGAGYVAMQESGGISYTLRFPRTAVFDDAAYFELQQAPENLLRRDDGILGLIAQAGEGDTLLAQQLAERPYWGPSTSSAAEDPNIRLEAMIEAARRGASVRLLLDAFFDRASSSLSNAATCARVREIAGREDLDLHCQRANPSGLGIHNKMILAHIGGSGYVQIGSWNGTEVASKGNREIAFLVQSDEAYRYLAALFEGDWPHETYLPALAANYRGAADHLLISEVLYDPYGADEAEFIEIVNPTASDVDLSQFSLGDAVSREDFEDVRRFPPGTQIKSKATLVVATSAAGFFAEYQRWPDFELLETNVAVPNLVDDATWGDTAAFLRLGNQGDEVILRGALDEVVDVVTYGSGHFPGQAACPLLSGTNHSLERFPYWRDADDCPSDFRDWPFPSPGTTP